MVGSVCSLEEKAAAALDEDEIFTTSLLDNLPLGKAEGSAWILRFNDVLDADKLSSSLTRLVSTDKWRKLAGRLRLGEQGKLEFHVPRNFTKKRPAITHTHETHEMGIDEHPLAKLLPRSTEGPSIQPGPAQFRPLAARPDAPTEPKDFYNHDVPVLSLHIVSFNDATLVSLSFPHALMDAMGQYGLLRAWSAVLAGEEPPAMVEAHDDALCDVAASKAEMGEEYILKSHILRGLRLFLFLLIYIWDFLFSRLEARTVFVPKAIVETLHSKANRDPEGVEPDEASWVSEGDAIVAWVTQLVGLAQRRRRAVGLMTAVDIRAKLPGILQPSSTYIQNLFMVAQVVLPPDDIRGSLRSAALAHRRGLTAQTTPAQALAYLRMQHEQCERGSYRYLPCLPPGALPMITSNWTKAGLLHAADFKAAVVRQGEGSAARANPLGSMVHHHALTLAKKHSTPLNLVVILGKDREGNYWFTGYFSPRTWLYMDTAFQILNQ